MTTGMELMMKCAPTIGEVIEAEKKQARREERELAMAAILDGCPNDGSDAEIILRRAWERVRVMPNSNYGT